MWPHSAHHAFPTKLPRLEVVERFQSQLKNPADLSVPVAAIQALTECVGKSQGRQLLLLPSLLTVRRPAPTMYQLEL